MRYSAVPFILCVLALAPGCNRERDKAPNFSGERVAIPVRSAGQQSYADLVDKVAPAVVTIRSERHVRAPRQFPFLNDPFFRRFFGERSPYGGNGGEQVQRGLGSGVTVSENGYIVTNHHVVDGAEDITVEYAQGKNYRARLVGSDPPSDLAVLKVNASGLPVLQLGDSDAVRVGDIALAVGNPLGIGQTVTMGIISAKGRRTGLSDGSFEDFLQTDAPINRGNSGGALVNTAGQLIGVNSQIVSPSGGNIGIGFAIPSNMARSVMDQLIKSGEVKRGQMGVNIQPLTEDLAQGFGLKDTKGVLVSDVVPGSPADRAGIKAGDVIRAVNGREIDTPNSLRNTISSMGPGTDVTLKVLRGGQEQQFKVKLGTYEGPSSQSRDAEGDDGGAPQAGQTRLGITVQPLTPDIARELGIRGPTSGLLVRSVAAGSSAARAGVAPGDVIVEANRQAVRSTADLQRAAGNSSVIILRIARDGQTGFVTIRTR